MEMAATNSAEDIFISTKHLMNTNLTVNVVHCLVIFIILMSYVLTGLYLLTDLNLGLRSWIVDGFNIICRYLMLCDATINTLFAKNGY